MAKANLLKGPYLHTWKWNFFRNAGALPQLSDANAARLDFVKQEISKELSSALQRENVFFLDYNISGPNRNKQWAQQHLITTGKEGSDEQKIYKILNDNQFIYILTGQKYQKLLIKRFAEEFEIAVSSLGDSIIDDITLQQIRE